MLTLQNVSISAQCMSIFIRNVPSIRLIFNTLYSIFSIFPIFPKDQYGRNGIPHWSCFSDAHTREAQQIWGTSPILPLPEREARGWFCEEPKNTAAPNVTSLTEGCMNLRSTCCVFLCFLIWPTITMYFNTGSMAQLFVFYFGENRWRHPTDGRDMNRERNSSKSWGDGNLDSMSVYGHQLHRFIFSHQKQLKVSLWPVLQLFSPLLSQNLLQHLSETKQ